MLLISLPTYLCLVICVQGSHFIPRQSSNSTLSIDVYIKQAQTVIYAIDQIKLNETRTACNDNMTEARLNSTGLDGTLGHLLLCEDSVGVVIFPNITQAERETEAALSALQAAKNGTSTNTNCKNLRLDALGQAGLDTEAIAILLCKPMKAAPPTPSASPLWGNTTKPYEDNPFSPTASGIRVNVSRLAVEPVPSASSSFITTMANGAAVTLPISIILNSSFSTILSPSLAATTSGSSAGTDQQFSANIPLNATFSTVLAITVTSTTSITTTLPAGTTQGPLTLTSTASASLRDPRTITIWEVVYVTAIQPSSTRIPLTATFSTQLVPVVTVTSTTSITTTLPPHTTQAQSSGQLTLTSTASASVRDPRTITIWQVVYVTAIKPSASSTRTIESSSNSLRIPLTASFSTQLTPVVTVTSTTSIFTTGTNSLTAVTLTSTHR
ncbi:hypothetical protein HII31_13535 [Pseudocercospora fuligena]|uniref:Uncharacterized protein n=1 Tax=Pseudocercospora fuligena TaxID=685502 RepID=A0A8H6VBM0_9PEZI|nr:hypothetical protein HII31_13535 [Pseudocercospora fuligena]